MEVFFLLRKLPSQDFQDPSDTTNFPVKLSHSGALRKKERRRNCLRTSISTRWSRCLNMLRTMTGSWCPSKAVDSWWKGTNIYLVWYFFGMTLDLGFKRGGRMDDGIPAWWDPTEARRYSPLLVGWCSPMTSIRCEIYKKKSSLLFLGYFSGA